MRFVCDSMVGRLAKWLRILGFDCAYCRSGKKAELLRLSLNEGRTVLTRDGSFVRRYPDKSFLVKGEELKTQLMQVIRDLRLHSDVSPFSRCAVCNTPLVRKSKADAKGKVPFFVYQSHEEFVYCPSCDRYYWEGSHHRAILERLAELGVK